MMARLSRTVHGFIHSDNKPNWLKTRLEWVLFRLRLWREERNNRAFDRRYRTDTARELPLNEAGIPGGGDLYGVYRPLWEGTFHRAISLVPIDLAQFTFVDIGSGKGKLLLLAAQYPFKAIEGVEYGERLHHAAERNIAIFHKATRTPVPIRSALGDATLYELPAGPVLCMIFNSFDEVTTNNVLRRIAAQGSQGKRPVFVIYANLRNVDERTIGRGGACPAQFKQLHRTRNLVLLGNGEAEALWQKRRSKSWTSEVFGNRA